MGNGPLQPVPQQGGMAGGVVDPVDHGILIGDPPAGFGKIPAAGRKQGLHPRAPVDGHEGAPGFIVGGMEGHRQGELKSLLRQAVNPPDQSTGGQGNVAHANVHTVRVVDQGQKPPYIVIVVQRLPNPHQNNVGDGDTGIFLGKNDLVQQFSRRQVADPPPHCGGAEGTAHGAAHLGGNTDGVAMAVAHENRLNAVAVRQPPKIFYGSIQF